MQIQKKAGDSYGVDISFQQKGRGEKVRCTMNVWTPDQYIPGPPESGPIYVPGQLIATLVSSWKSLTDRADWSPPQSLSVRGTWPTLAYDGLLVDVELFVDGETSGRIWVSGLRTSVYQNLVPIGAPAYQAFAYTFV